MLITIIKKIENDTPTEQQPVSIIEVAENQTVEIPGIESKSLQAVEDVLEEDNHSSNTKAVEKSDFSENDVANILIEEIEIEKYEIRLLFLNDFNEWNDKEEVEFAIEVLIDEIEKLTPYEIDSIGNIPINPFLFRPLLDALVIDPDEDEFVSRFNKKEMMQEIAQTIFETYKNEKYFVRLS
jgi:hypothetical protein